jgi:hypothetical protein
MRLLKFKNMAMIGAMSMAGVGLIGVGAHATFTQGATNAQTISTGTMAVVLYSPTALSGNSTASLVLANYGPVGSTFSTGREPITVVNNSTIPVTGVSATFGATGGSVPLYNELNICLEDNAGNVVWQGLLSAATGTATIPSLGPIAVGGQETYYVTYYAGAQSFPGSDCAATTAASLDNTVSNQNVTPTVTITYNG